MDIHKPKAAKSWREFAIEIGTIVVGILIALGLEQVAEAVRHRGEAREARETIRAEIVTDITRVVSRQKAEPCVERRIAELEASLLHPDAEGRIAKLAWIGRAPRYAIESSRWAAASQSGRASLLTPDEQGRYGFLHTALAYFYDMENGEQAAWSKLRALEGIERLSPDSQLTARMALQDAEFYDASGRQVGGLILKRAADLGLKPTPHTDGPWQICLPKDTPPDRGGF
jgi:hypothetical protein